MKKKRTIIIRTIVSAISVIALFLQSILLWSINYYGKISNDNPVIENATLDLSEFKYDGKGIHTYGNVEFYYDQWIMTDNISNPTCDGYQSLPYSWAGKKIQKNNETMLLDGDGYASYRFTINNIKAGSPLSVRTRDYGDSLRVYFDDTLVYTSGTLSKTKESNDISIANATSHKYTVPDNGTVIVTIEVGNNGVGGLKDVVLLRPENYSSRSTNTTEAIIFLCLGILIATIATSLIFLLSDIKRKEYINAFFSAVFLLLAVLFSTDGLVIFQRYNTYINHPLAQFLHFLFSVVFSMFININSWDNDPRKLKPKRHKFFIFLALLAITSWYPLYNTSLNFLPYVFWFLSLFLLFPILIKEPFKIISPSFNYIIIAFSIGDIIFEFSKTVIPFNHSTKSAFSITGVLLALIFLFFFIFRFSLMYNSKKHKDQLKLEQIALRESTLKEQIMPHYLFNTLSVIRSLYHKDQDSGDEIMTTFSKNLRASLKLMKKEMIPFDDEIDVISHYIDLENERFENKFNLVLELDFTDFKVPPLTLEPVIENSVNYSKVNENEDGFISISSQYDGEYVTITIEDNGIGFDKKTVKKESIGQKNMKERLSLYLNATISVDSEVGKGTKTTITFPYKKGRL